jgi:hypothetical protein
MDTILLRKLIIQSSESDRIFSTFTCVISELRKVCYLMFLVYTHATCRHMFPKLVIRGFMVGYWL